MLTHSLSSYFRREEREGRREGGREGGKALLFFAPCAQADEEREGKRHAYTLIRDSLSFFGREKSKRVDGGAIDLEGGKEGGRV